MVQDFHRIPIRNFHLTKYSRHMQTRSLDLIRERYGREIGTEYVLTPKPMDASSPQRVRLPLYIAGLL